MNGIEPELSWIFALTDDAVELAAGLRELLSRACPPEVIRAAWPGGNSDLPERLWRDLAEFGLFGLLVSAEHGGLGLDEEYLVAAVEEIGYAGAPGPIVETVAFAAPLLAATDEQELLGRVLPGTSAVTARLGSGAVPNAQIASAALVGEPTSLRLVEVGERLTPRAGIDGSRASGDLHGAGAALAVDPALVRAAAERATLASAALLIGLARRLLDLTVVYVRERRQFGAPIGSFQAVKHSLADALNGGRIRPPRRAPGRLVAGRRGERGWPGRGSGARLDGEGAGRGCRRGRWRASDAVPTVRWATPTSTTCTCSPSGSWAVRHDWGGAGAPPGPRRARIWPRLRRPTRRVRMTEAERGRALRARGAVAVVTMNRPDYRNAQNSAMTYALDAAFYRAADDDEVKVIVLAGAGKHFSAGHDIGTPGPRHRHDVRAQGQPVVGPRRASRSGEPLRPRAGGLPRHVPALARTAQADDRHGAGRLHRRRADAGLVLRPDHRRRRRLLRRSGGADGHSRASSTSRTPGRWARASPRSSCSSASASTPRGPASSAWSTGSCRATSWNRRHARSPNKIADDAAPSAWR